MFSAITGLLGSYLEARAIGKVASAAEAWAYGFYRLMMALSITAFVCFLGTWGGTALAMWQSVGIWVGLGVGFATALSVTSLVIFNLWMRSELTKGIPIALPSSLAEAATNQDVTITQRS